MWNAFIEDAISDSTCTRELITSQSDGIVLQSRPGSSSTAIVRERDQQEVPRTLCRILQGSLRGLQKNPLPHTACIFLCITADSISRR